MATMHLSEENLSQLLCEEECGSIPDPELYCHFSVVTASSQEQLTRAPCRSAAALLLSCCSVTVCFRNISTQPLPPLAKPCQPGQGRASSLIHAEQMPAVFSDAIHVKTPRKRCFLQCHSFFKHLTALSSVMLCLQSSRSSFFFSTFCPILPPRWLVLLAEKLFHWS